MTERDLPGLWTRAWDVLAEGVRDASSPARIVALATAGPTGPEARMIALRLAFERPDLRGDELKAAAVAEAGRVMPGE